MGMVREETLEKLRHHFQKRSRKTSSSVQGRENHTWNSIATGAAIFTNLVPPENINLYFGKKGHKVSSATKLARSGDFAGAASIYLRDAVQQSTAAGKLIGEGDSTSGLAVQIDASGKLAAAINLARQGISRHSKFINQISRPEQTGNESFRRVMDQAVKCVKVLYEGMDPETGKYVEQVYGISKTYAARYYYVLKAAKMQKIGKYSAEQISEAIDAYAKLTDVASIASAYNPDATTTSYAESGLAIAEEFISTPGVAEAVKAAKEKRFVKIKMSDKELESVANICNSAGVLERVLGRVHESTDWQKKYADIKMAIESRN